jgi:hypothetical protein
MALTLGVIVHAYSYQNTHHYIQIIQSLANDYDFPTNFFFFLSMIYHQFPSYKHSNSYF